MNLGHKNFISNILKDFKLSDQLMELHQKALNAYNELSNLYPSTHSSDPRKYAAFNIASVVSTARIMKILYDNHLTNLDNSWFNDNKFMDKKKELESYILFSGWGALVFSYSHFETGIRNIIKELQLSDLSHTDSFYELYKHLFTEKLPDLRNDNYDPIQLLGLYGCLRNTMHNNGKYYPNTKKTAPKSYTWRDKKYYFEVGKNPNWYFGDWLFLTEDLVSLNFKVMSHKEIQKLTFPLLETGILAVGILRKSPQHSSAFRCKL